MKQNLSHFFTALADAQQQRAAAYMDMRETESLTRKDSPEKRAFLQEMSEIGTLLKDTKSGAHEEGIYASGKPVKYFSYAVEGHSAVFTLKTLVTKNTGPVNDPQPAIDLRFSLTRQGPRVRISEYSEERGYKKAAGEERTLPAGQAAAAIVAWITRTAPEELVDKVHAKAQAATTDTRTVATPVPPK